jgi:hypothetical protein
MQCACAILSYVDCPALQYFATLSHKDTIFEKKKLLYIKYVFRIFLQFLFETFSVLRRSERGVNENVYWSSLSVPFIRLTVTKFGFSRQICEKYAFTKFYENP